MTPLIQVDRITKRFGHLRALDRVTFSLEPGVIGLLGPNGAGKSTLIKVLLGLVPAGSGSGNVLGFRLGRDFRKIRACVGFMPEDDCYIAGLSGVDMLRFAARLSGLPSIEALRRSHEILDFCGVEEERYRPVETYSTGMRQKLKFAQAIVHDPDLLILDEPTAGLDPEEREAMLARVRTLAAKHKKSVLISTHILPDVQAACETVVILAKGRVRLVDSLERLCRPASPVFRVRVFGSPGELARRIHEAGYEVRIDDDGTIAVSADDQRFTERLWGWAESAGVGIRSLLPAKNSLEQIFLEAVHADS